MSTRQTLKAESSVDLLLLLLYAPGKQLREPIDGATRLQKLVFLLQQDISPRLIVKDAKAFEYQAFKMGPYSRELSETVDELTAAGIITTERLQFWLHDDSDAEAEYVEDTELRRESKKRIESLRYRIASGIGERAAEELWESLSKKAQAELVEFKRFFNSLSLRQLLIYTYQRFPDLTRESEIREQLGLGDDGN